MPNAESERASERASEIMRAKEREESGRRRRSERVCEDERARAIERVRMRMSRIEFVRALCIG